MGITKHSNNEYRLALYVSCHGPGSHVTALESGTCAQFATKFDVHGYVEASCTGIYSNAQDALNQPADCQRAFGQL